METQCPELLTAGKIAERLGVPLPRVQYILRTRPKIRPAARAGTIRLYRAKTLRQVWAELDGIAARQKGGAR